MRRQSFSFFSTEETASWRRTSVTSKKPKWLHHASASSWRAQNSRFLIKFSYAWRDSSTNIINQLHKAFCNCFWKPISKQLTTGFIVECKKRFVFHYQYRLTNAKHIDLASFHWRNKNWAVKWSAAERKGPETMSAAVAVASSHSRLEATPNWKSCSLVQLSRYSFWGLQHALWLWSLIAFRMWLATL